MRLVIDIGGTNIRFARADAAEGLSHLIAVPWAQHPELMDALESYLAQTPDGAEISEVVLDVAAPVDGPVVQLTNRDAVVDGRAISARLGGARVRIVNDLEAVALALPYLGEDDTRCLRASRIGGEKPMIAVNVGTGFGASAVCQTAAGWHALPSESGYVHLSPRNEAEAAFFGAYNTIEDYVSGRGLAALREAHPGHAMLDPNCEAFNWHFGRATGDLVAATGAWGGVYLVGGVLDAWSGEGDALAAFLDGFQSRGLMSDRFEQVGIHWVTLANPALLGLAHALA